MFHPTVGSRWVWGVHLVGSLSKKKKRPKSKYRTHLLPVRNEKVELHAWSSSMFAFHAVKYVEIYNLYMQFVQSQPALYFKW